MNSASLTFDYPVTVAGSYSFHCAIHSSMTGSFTATNPNGINTPEISALFKIATVNESAYKISFTLPQSSGVKLSLYDITGKVARVLLSDYRMAGDYSDIYFISDLKQGIYVIELSTGSERITKRMIIE
jgi:hypothetical protein